jgi:hypothetical protein
MMTTPHHNTTTTATAVVVSSGGIAAAAAADNASALWSNASTPAGSAKTSPVLLLVKKALAPKKLIVREPLRASFKIKSQTIFPSSERRSGPVKKVWEAQKKAGAIPLPSSSSNSSTAAQEDAEIARNLPAIPYRKKDQAGNPYYRPWARLNELGEGGCPSKERLVVLVHLAGDNDDKPKKDVYMNFQTYKQHLLTIKGIKEEWPIAVRFGADLEFHEDERLRAKRIEAEAACAGGKEVFQKQGRFRVVWRTTHADQEGYAKFMA